MNNSTLIVVVLVGAVALGAVYLMTRTDSSAAFLSAGAAPAGGDPNRPEATYYIEAVGGAVGSLLGGVGSIISSAYGGGGEGTK